MRSLRFVFAAMAAGALAFSLFAGEHLCTHAKGHDQRQCWEKGMCMMNKLNLTQEQKAKLKTEREQGREARQEIFSKIREIRGQAKEELLKPQPSKSALEGYAQGLANLHKQMMQLEYEHLLRVKAILSTEQFKTLLECEGRRQKGMDGKRALGCKEGKRRSPDAEPL